MGRADPVIQVGDDDGLVPDRLAPGVERADVVARGRRSDPADVRPLLSSPHSWLNNGSLGASRAVRNSRLDSPMLRRGLPRSSRTAWSGSCPSANVSNWNLAFPRFWKSSVLTSSRACARSALPTPESQWTMTSSLAGGAFVSDQAFATGGTGLSAGTAAWAAGTADSDRAAPARSARTGRIARSMACLACRRTKDHPKSRAWRTHPDFGTP